MVSEETGGTLVLASGLKIGDKGDDVALLQGRLVQLGYLRVKGERRDTSFKYLSDLPECEPRKFDENTEFALRQFQLFREIPVTGRVDDSSVYQLTLHQCGNPDQEASDISRAPCRWTLDITYGFINYNTPHISQADIRSGVEAALKLWSDVT